MKQKIITLLTDFGTSDTYVAQMKGVLYSLVENLAIVDITHQIPPQQILIGARALRDAFFLFPQGATHLAVVDPGVGSTRKLIAAKIAGHQFVLPDNGLLEFILRDFPLEIAVQLSPNLALNGPISPTFHGRDIIAPVGAMLANGTNLREIGEDISDLTRLAVPTFRRDGGSLLGEVASIDSFGNVITNIPSAECQFSIGHEVSVKVGERWESWSWQNHYASSKPGAKVALNSSNHFLELAINCGSAAKVLDISIGQPIEVVGD